MSSSEQVARMVSGMVRGMSPELVINQASRLFWVTARGDEWEPERYQSCVDAVGSANARLIERLARTTQASEIVAACGLSGLMQIEATELQPHMPVPRAVMVAATLVRVQALINTILDLAPDLEDAVDDWYCGQIRPAAVAK